ncbi:MAG: selenocysteine-specific translation elongation factor [Holophagales bacterium]|nr:selenocysteine-specific translation elongation factor [Holophagales bacterium]MBK9964750.1 selenocysteine-specific translation elongation factor [Holophagales bacterium]
MARVLVGTAGHIDHGKSALVKALTGTDPDRLPEEKARGITIDLGFAHAEWGGTVFSFVDVPGHEKFVRTMVAGVAGIDVALLVVASDDSVMPQTREHLDILTLLDVSCGILVRTKADLVDEETGAVVEAELRDLVAGTFLESAPLVAVSAVTGSGLDGLRTALTTAARRSVRRNPSARPTRLWVDRSFSMKGFGPVVTGTLDSGRIRPEDRLVLFPSGEELRVRRVEVHGEERPVAEAGERTSLNLAGIESAELTRGMCLVAPGTLSPATLLTVDLTALASLDGTLEDSLSVRFHSGTADVPARLHLLGEGEDASAPLPPGSRAVAQITCREPVAVRRGDRFVLRRPSPQETIGGGRVLDTARPRVRRRNPLRAASVAVLREGDERSVATLFLSEAGPAGLDVPALAQRLGIPAEAAAGHVETLVASGSALKLSPTLAVAASASIEMATRADAFFAERRKAGVPTLFVGRRELLGKIARELPEATGEAWLATLAAAKRLVVAGDQAGPAGSAPSGVTDEAGGFAKRIEEAWRTAGFEAPRTHDLAKALGTKNQVVEGLVAHLIKGGALVRLSPDVIAHSAFLAGIEEKVAAETGRTMSVGDFRDLLGLSRKYLIPLLEYLDRKRRTRRVGDARVVE